MASTRARRAGVVLVAAAMMLGAMQHASSATFTTFDATSEGCSGGGDVCGTFPLVPSGDAEYTHAASSDGAIEISSSTEGGVPIDLCLPAACPPGRYHAEALASVWVDVDVPAGAPSVSVAADYRLDQLVADAQATIGTATADLDGTIAISVAGPLGLCSDGSAIAGVTETAIESTTALGLHSFETALACAGGSGLLPGARWRVGLSFTVSSTSDGGAATAAVGARLLSVEVVGGS